MAARRSVCVQNIVRLSNVHIFAQFNCFSCAERQVLNQQELNRFAARLGKGWEN
jgi:hypothetical protein